MSFHDKEDVTISDSNKEKRQANRVRRLSINAYQQLEQQYLQLYNLIWDNPSGIGPQKIFDCFGTDGQDLLDFMDAMESMLIATDNGYISPEPSDGVNQTSSDGGVVTVL